MEPMALFSFGTQKREFVMLAQEGIKTQLESNTDVEESNKRNGMATEQPLRMEVFSAEQRMEKGRILARKHTLIKDKDTVNLLLHRLSENETILRSVHRKLVDDVTEKKPITSVGEWLVDNFYIIEEQISLAIRHLPKRYLSELPQVAAFVGAIPRVYDIAEKIIAYGDGRVEVDDVSSVIAAYQEVTPLKLGELWAIPIMLRLALIENIRRMAVLTEKNRDDRHNAMLWADEIIKVEAADPKNVILAVADMARAEPELTNSFVAEFKRKLNARGSGLKLPLQWVEQHLTGDGESIEEAVAEENRIQAVMEISIRNSINSLRSLNVTDWKEFVENLSKVESTLRRDPAGVYANMDFSTRDGYHRIVEQLAKQSNSDEVAVAEKCLELARIAGEKGEETAFRHVGYYLISDGEHELKKSISFKGGIGDYVRTASSRMTLGLYLGSIAVLTVLFTFAISLIAYEFGVAGNMLTVLVILFAVAMCHVAVGLVNFVSTMMVKPRPLPRLDFHKGIPRDMRTLVVVPMIINSEKVIRNQLKNLETHFLNNRGPYVHFALLTDFADADAEHMPSDDELLELCRSGIVELNDKHPEKGGDNFFLLHRPRKWNETEKLWMGYERKRGKLEDLNRYLMRKDTGVFSIIEGRKEALSGVSYVVTLDADTMMARDSVWQLVGTMAHPLVQPKYDAQLGRVVRGHGILQPRVDSGLSGANRSHYARMTASDIGIDPYTRVSSDVYQDLFDEGSFIGKGIYDVKTFNTALAGRFPDNKILSHDLLEGCVMRSGLINDVKFYEDPPASYLADIFRRHRWIRGDWQIASYLVGKDSRPEFKNAKNLLNVLSRWKIFDNLRRSVTALFILALLVLGLTILSRPGVYVLIVFCIFIIPLTVNSINSLMRKSPDNTFRQHFSNLFSIIGKEVVQAIFKFSCLPYEAYVNANAIVRSLWRQCISHRYLLQWNPSDNTMREKVTHFGPILRRMWINPVFAVAMTAILRLENREILPWALPLFVLWLIAPVIVAWFSKPLATAAETLEADQVDFLRKVSRRTWLFFEDFVDGDNNWLPPDNYQEYPGGKVAARTSPTNMGLSLLANLSAYDFGFATAGNLLTRTERTITTMCRMERFKGHFYNWYDTVSLRVLHPAYISTVDSGNLAAHILILNSGLTSLRDEPIVGSQLFVGLKDTMDLAVAAFDGSDSPFTAGMEKLAQDTDSLATNPPTGLLDFYSEILKLSERAESILQELEKYTTAAEDDTLRWSQAFSTQCKDIILDLETLTPWVREMHSIPEWGDVDFLDDIPSLNCLAALEERLPSLPKSLATQVECAIVFAKKRLAEIEDIVLRCEDLTNIEYGFLYDKTKRLLSIGYNADERRLDTSVYDLLASEARLATYLGIVQHKLPQSSWFALGRMLTKSGGRALLVSWSGSMFEYLMPLLVMPTVEETLLDETYKSCVLAQAKYGEGKGVPWGISESGYNVFDSLQNYQYRAFGVPELGLRHGLSDDLVIAPYASCLAAMVYPCMACRNLQRLVGEGVQTRYGFYEAMDYTPSRKPHGEDSAVVRSYMVHHQGMSLVALGQALLGQPMHKRFQNHALLQSASMLLEEIVPDEKALYYHATYTPEIRTDTTTEESPVRVVTNPNSLQPEVQLLSNGNYSVMLSGSGAGYSRWHNTSLTRWREDGTQDGWGTFCYVRDHDTNNVWSTTYQPMPTPTATYEAAFSEGKAEFNRHDKYFDTHTEVVVSPEDDIEVRRVRIVNKTNTERRLDLTTFAEVVLSPSSADDSHQAFNKLFVETRLLKDQQAILCSRRPRSKEEKTPFLFHMMVARSDGADVLSYETDRLKFMGRGNSAANLQALMTGEGGLTNSEGAVLDPVISIRAPILIGPGEDMIFDIVTGVGETEEAVMALIEKYHDERMTNKAFDLAWMHGQLLLRQLNITETDSQLYCHLASSIVYVNPAMRARPEILIRNYQGQSGLWGYSISGDLPIALVKITDPDHVQLASEMIQAHAYWRLKGLPVDLIIWNDDQSGYRQSLHDQMTGLAVAALGESNLERPGGVFIRSVDRVSDEDKVLIQTVARIVLSDNIGSLSDHIRKQIRREFSPTTIVQYRPPQLGGTLYPSDPLEKRKLLLANGYGGFSEDGTEYIITTDKERRTPAHGSMSLRTTISGPWCRRAARPTPGAKTPTNSGSPPGTTIR